MFGWSGWPFWIFRRSPPSHLASRDHQPSCIRRRPSSDELCSENGRSPGTKQAPLGQESRPGYEADILTPYRFSTDQWIPSLLESHNHVSAALNHKTADERSIKKWICWLWKAGYFIQSLQLFTFWHQINWQYQRNWAFPLAICLTWFTRSGFLCKYYFKAMCEVLRRRTTEEKLKLIPHLLKYGSTFGQQKDQFSLSWTTPLPLVQVVPLGINLGEFCIFRLDDCFKKSPRRPKGQV